MRKLLILLVCASSVGCARLRVCDAVVTADGGETYA